MAALKKSQRILRSHGLIVNFLFQPLKIGDIVQADDGRYIIVGNIEKMIPGFSLEGKVRASNQSEFKLTQESNITVSVGGTADSSVAAGEIELKFNSKNSAFVVLKGATRKTIPTSLIEEELKNLWKSKGYDQPGKRNRFHFINEIIEAESGTIIFSQEKANIVTITGKNNTPLTSVSVVGEGKVEYVTNRKATLEIISEKPIKPIFSALRIKSNGLFETVN